jgi:hypothetical protein
VFNDEASTAVQCPPNGAYQPAPDELANGKARYPTPPWSQR